MENGDTTDIVFAIDADNDGWILSAHKDVLDDLYDHVGSVNMEEGGFANVPVKPGVYKAKCTFQVIDNPIADDGFDYSYTLSEIEEYLLKESVPCAV